MSLTVLRSLLIFLNSAIVIPVVFLKCFCTGLIDNGTSSINSLILAPLSKRRHRYFTNGSEVILYWSESFNNPFSSKSKSEKSADKLRGLISENISFRQVGNSVILLAVVVLFEKSPSIHTQGLKRMPKKTEPGYISRFILFAWTPRHVTPLKCGTFIKT